MFAVAQTDDSETGGTIQQYFHNMLWLQHFRSIPEDCVVVHKNGITVDNRLVNLELVRDAMNFPVRPLSAGGVPRCVMSHFLPVCMFEYFERSICFLRVIWSLALSVDPDLV